MTANFAARKAVVLLSGGLDSSVAAAQAKADGFEVFGLSVDYGQRHVQELWCASEQGRRQGMIDHRILPMDLRSIGGSALTSDLAVPKDHLGEGIPVTYVPARNTVLLGLALGYAEVVDADAIYLGVNAVDYSGYPDCRPAFIEAFEALAAVATKRGIEGRPIKIAAPLLRLTKAEIVARGRALGVAFEHTHSCYDPDMKGRACGHCDSCLIRLKAFETVGMKDPARYQ